jgi:acyl carrier protein phosphodiesterase/glutathione synthase/RimK-type ligase-like ATP-grasp enzyme
MNYLAHIYLSENDKKVAIGNFISDSIRGKNYKNYPKDIQVGILLHREIDTFTDAHKTVRQSTKRLHENYGHYAGVIVDVFYDHFLAKNWSNYSSIPLNDFISDFYDNLKSHKKILPKRIQEFMPYMIEDNWLESYQRLEGIQWVLDGINRRTNYRSKMNLALKELQEFYSEFETEFTSFFEDLIQFSKTKHNEIHTKIMQTEFDCVVLTDQRYLNKGKDQYTQNVYTEDDLVLKALKNEGLNATRLAWDDTNFDWSNTKTILFRTTWDYFDRFDEFSIWLENVSKQTLLLNSETIIRWNIDKHYLNDLKAKNIHIAETFFIEKNTTKTLKEIHKSLNWKETVLKPCISGAARHTYKLNEENIEKHETIFKKLINKEALMLQPFQHNIVNKGEISLMVFNGTFTHAVLKKAKAGDFRVQDDFGGSVHDYKPTKDEITFAENAVKACIELPIYARVDVFEDNNGKIALSELELIEPELWFRKHPEAATILAKAISKLL